MTQNILMRLICLATLLLGMPSLNAQSQDTQGTQTMDQEAIHAVVEANNAAVSGGDIEGALATFEASAAMVAQPGLTVTGTAALRGAFQQFFAISPKITTSAAETVMAGDIALHSFTWTMTGKAPDGSPITQAGFSSVVLRKQADGRWLMVIDNPFADMLLRKN